MARPNKGPRYRRISSRLWADQKFRALSRPQANAQSLWIFFLSGPMLTGLPGIFGAGEAAMAEELGWSVKDFGKAFKELKGAGMAAADWDARLVWLPNGLRHDPPANLNVVAGWMERWGDLPECGLKETAAGVFAAYMEELGAEYPARFARVISASAERNSKQGYLTMLDQEAVG